MKTYKWLIFSREAPFVTLGIGGTWFLVNVLQLSTADFGEHRITLFLGFLVILVLSFLRMRELIALRGVAVLMLLCANLQLGGVCGEAILFRIFFVSFVYLSITFAMIVCCNPYMLRNLLEMLMESEKARRVCGIFFALCAGLFLYSSLCSGR
ncbi:MAG: hypothetical protein LBI81_01260 [Puniceicoccales bacterium]|nr:hypothetical protein [Puniceicoccales bacterium]